MIVKIMNSIEKIKNVEENIFMKFTSESTLSEVLNNPVGYDVAQKVVYRKNMSADILSDESFCQKTLGELLTDKVSDEAMKYLLDILKRLCRMLVFYCFKYRIIGTCFRRCFAACCYNNIIRRYVL